MPIRSQKIGLTSDISGILWSCFLDGGRVVVEVMTVGYCERIRCISGCMSWLLLTNPT